MLDQPVGHIFTATDTEGTPPSQRLHLILLGVKDVAKSKQFYERLGWCASPTGHEGFVKIDLGGYALCLLPIGDFAKDALSPSAEEPAFSGTGFVYLAKTPEDVPNILSRAVTAGGQLVKPATRTPWGIAGYFKDPDGHLFEVDYETTWVFTEDHKLVVDELNNC